MTVGELITLLQKFPARLPVYFSPDLASPRALTPQLAAKHLVHPIRGEAMTDNDPYATLPPGFVDSLVIYPGEAPKPASDAK